MACKKVGDVFWVLIAVKAVEVWWEQSGIVLC